MTGLTLTSGAGASSRRARIVALAVAADFSAEEGKVAAQVFDGTPEEVIEKLISEKVNRLRESGKKTEERVLEIANRYRRKLGDFLAGGANNEAGGAGQAPKAAVSEIDKLRRLHAPRSGSQNNFK